MSYSIKVHLFPFFNRLACSETWSHSTLAPFLGQDQHLSAFKSQGMYHAAYTCGH